MKSEAYANNVLVLRFKFDSIERKIMLHVCYNNEKKIGVKPGNSRNETGQQSERNRAHGMKPSRRLGKQPRNIFGHYMVTTRSLQSAFQIRFATFRIFHEWLKFRADTRIISVTYAAWLRST